MKENYGVTLDDLQAGKMGLKSREKRKTPSLDEIGGFRKRKLYSSRTSQDERVINDKIRVPALVPANVKLIYLTRNVIEKLLMEPDSFKNKVKRTFVGIELPQKAGSNKVVRQLVQVTGITKTSGDDDRIPIKLQAKNSMPNDISIDRVSDLDFSEIVCKDLIQQVKDGQIEMPTVDELERMAKALSEVIVDDFIVRETRKLQNQMDRANERGRRQEFFLLEANMNLLRTSQERLQLIRRYQNVSIEEHDIDPMSGQIINEAQEIKDSSELISSTVTQCENDTIDSVGPRSLSENLKDDKKPKECRPKLIAENLELSIEKSSGNYCKESLGISHRVKKKASGEQGMKFSDNIGNLSMGDDQELINVADDSNLQSFADESECKILKSFGEVLEQPNRVDVMHEEFENYADKSSEKIDVVVKDKQKTPEAKPDDELSMLKNVTQGFSLIVAKLVSMEDKMDCVEQKINHMEEKAQSAEEAVLLSYNKKSDLFMDALLKLMEPVCSLACTKTIEEIKAKYSANLDLSLLPTYDPNAIERLHPLFKGILQSSVDGLMPQGTTEEKPIHCPESEMTCVQPPDN